MKNIYEDDQNQEEEVPKLNKADAKDKGKIEGREENAAVRVQNRTRYSSKSF